LRTLLSMKRRYLAGRCLLGHGDASRRHCVAAITTRRLSLWLLLNRTRGLCGHRLLRILHGLRRGRAGGLSLRISLGNCAATLRGHSHQIIVTLLRPS